MESRIEMEVELRTGTKRGIGWLVASFHGRFLSRVLVRTERTSCDCWWDESRSNRKDKLQKKSLKREIKPQCIQRHTRWKVWSFQLIYLLFLFIYFFIFLFVYGLVSCYGLEGGLCDAWLTAHLILLPFGIRSGRNRSQAAENHVYVTLT